MIDRLTAAARPPLAEWIGQHRALVLTAVQEGGPPAWRALAEAQIEKNGQPTPQTMPLSWALRALWAKFIQDESESWAASRRAWRADAQARGTTDAKLLKELKQRLSGYPGNAVRFGPGDAECYIGFPYGSDECKLESNIWIRRGTKGWRVPVQYQFTRDEIIQAARDTLGIGMPKKAAKTEASAGKATIGTAHHPTDHAEATVNGVRYRWYQAANTPWTLMEAIDEATGKAIDVPARSPDRAKSLKLAKAALEAEYEKPEKNR